MIFDNLSLPSFFFFLTHEMVIISVSIYEKSCREFLSKIRIFNPGKIEDTIEAIYPVSYPVSRVQRCRVNIKYGSLGHGVECLIYISP